MTIFSLGLAVYTSLEASLLGCFPKGLQPLLGVGLRQPKAAAVLVDLEAYSAAVNFCDPAELRELLRKAPQTLFQIRVVGGDLHHGIRFVEIDLRIFLLFVQNVSPPKIY